MYRSIADDLVESESLEQLLKAVYQPYRPYLVKYKVLEEVALSKALDNIKLVSVKLRGQLSGFEFTKMVILIKFL